LLKIKLLHRLKLHISRDGEVLDLAVEKDIVEKSGAWYAYKGEKIGQGRENAKTFLSTHSEIMEEITQAIKDSLESDNKSEQE